MADKLGETRTLGVDLIATLRAENERLKRELAYMTESRDLEREEARLANGAAESAERERDAARVELSELVSVLVPRADAHGTLTHLTKVMSLEIAGMEQAFKQIVSACGLEEQPTISGDVDLIGQHLRTVTRERDAALEALGREREAIDHAHAFLEEYTNDADTATHAKRVLFNSIQARAAMEKGEQGDG